MKTSDHVLYGAQLVTMMGIFAFLYQRLHGGLLEGMVSAFGCAIAALLFAYLVVKWDENR